MHSVSNFHVLYAFRPLAHTLTVYNSENFSRDHSTRIIGQNILQAVANSAKYFSMIAVSSMYIWMFYALEMDWAERAFFIGLMLSQMQQVFIYAAMTKENRQIICALDQLQQTIDKRKRPAQMLNMLVLCYI